MLPKLLYYINFKVQLSKFAQSIGSTISVYFYLFIVSVALAAIFFMTIHMIYFVV